MKTENVFFKMKSTACLAVLLFVLQMQILNAQAIPDPGFDWCNDDPTDAELSTLNRFLAYSNAPILYQQLDKSEFYYDLPVVVNFDGNLNSADNWNNAFNLQFSLPVPSVYYTVLWTRKYIIITYSLFYPRNWVNCNNGVNEHNNDLERILITIDRCDISSSAIITTHHGKTDFDSCSEETDILFPNYSARIVPDDDNDPMITVGKHPVVFISWGSHASYLTYRGAKKDGWNAINPCHANTLGTCWRFLSPNPGAVAVSGCSDGYYRLVDVFAPGGLWDSRDVPGLFIGDNFDCGGYPCGVSTPWNGDLGRNPLDYLSVTATILNITVGRTICGDLITDDTYVSNPYYCDPPWFTLLSNVSTVCGDDPFMVSLSKNVAHPDVNIPKVAWDFPSYLECVGCEEGDADANFTWVGDLPNIPTVRIQATIEIPGCGTQTIIEDIRTGRPNYPEDITASFDPCRSIIYLHDNSNPNTPDWTWDWYIIGLENTPTFVRNSNPAQVRVGYREGEEFCVQVRVTNNCGQMTTDGASICFTTPGCHDEGGNSELNFQENPNSANELIFPTETTHNYGIETNTEQQSTNLHKGSLDLIIPANANTAIKVFPNPFNDQIHIQLKLQESEQLNRIFITDIHGRLQKDFAPVRIRSERLGLDTSSLPQGVYFLSIKTNANSYTHKITKVNN